jgi:hypothetical protein
MGFAKGWLRIVWAACLVALVTEENDCKIAIRAGDEGDRGIGFEGG